MSSTVAGLYYKMLKNLHCLRPSLSPSLCLLSHVLTYNAALAGDTVCLTEYHFTCMCSYGKRSAEAMLHYVCPTVGLL
jgi:hypothetical protein